MFYGFPKNEKDLFFTRGVGVLMEGIFMKRVTHVIQDAAGAKVDGSRWQLFYSCMISGAYTTSHCSTVSWCFMLSSNMDASGSLMPTEKRWSPTLGRRVLYARATSSPHTVSPAEPKQGPSPNRAPPFDSKVPRVPIAVL